MLGLDSIGAAAWNPAVMALAFLVLLLLVLALRAFGRGDFAKDKLKTQPFLSGNAPTEKNRVRADNFFWGFFEALRPYYRRASNVHSGLLNDYIFWFAFCLALLLIALYAGVSLWA